MEKEFLSEAERSEKQEILKLVSEKDTLSLQEFTKFIHRVCGFITEMNGLEKDEDNFYLPNSENPAIHIDFALDDEFVNILILDGLGKESGETVTSIKRESDDKLAWCIGISDSFYSKLLERLIFVGEGEKGDYIMAEEPLTPAELHKLAKVICDHLPQ